jgi:Pro-kumamolisin, activation domain/Putative Ig domain
MLTTGSPLKKQSGSCAARISEDSKLLMAIAPRRLSALLAAALFLLLPRLATAQTALPLERITTPINDGQVTQLKGNLSPRAIPQNDLGVADSSMQLRGITIMFQPTAAQKADLDALLPSLQDPASPNFHKWLSPKEYGARFGIAPADMAKITVWLESKGLVVIERPVSQNYIVVNGTVAQVNAAFRTEIHNYSAKGEKFIASSTEPSLPAAFAGLVAGFRGLETIRLKPHLIRSAPSTSKIQPHFTSASSGNNYMSPLDLQTIYDLTPLYNATPKIDGTGQKIAIVGQSNINLNDVATFQTAAGIPLNPPTITETSDSFSNVLVSGDVDEAYLDVEWAGAVANKASITLVYSEVDPLGNGGVFSALQYAIQNNIAPVISMSYGACEATFSTAAIQSVVSLAQEANALGITIVTAAGDGGATDCDGGAQNYPAQLGLSVDFPSSMPYVTAVGGTEFDESFGGSQSTYWNPATSGTVDLVNSARSYIPEFVWNDSPQGNPQLLSAGGGGASTIFAKPSWQAGTGVPADGFRDVPDVALNAAVAHDPYIVCTNDSTAASPIPPCINGTFYTSATHTDNNLALFGGTSFGAPIFAGMVALVNQKTGSTGQGNINYTLYPLAAISSAASSSASPTAAFHDIVPLGVPPAVDNNASPCNPGSIDCPTGINIGFSDGLGYDQATGLGSVDGANLVNLWSSIPATGGSTPILTSIMPSSATAGAAAFTLTAMGSNFSTTNAQILWNGSPTGVTMISGGSSSSTSISATISPALVAYGTTASITVTDNGAKAGESSAATFTVNAAGPPANDNIANAIAITSSNFSSIVDNSLATTETVIVNGTSVVVDPPLPSTGATPCYSGNNSDTKTVWWTLVAALAPGGSTTANVTLDTIGSPYDTTLSVWTGTPGVHNGLTNVACNDDIAAGTITQSRLTFPSVAGTTYYIMVAPFDGTVAGGKTVLNVTGANPAPTAPAITSANSATFTVGIPGSFNVTSTGSPAPQYSVLVPGFLPPGLGLDGQAGTISGIPTTAGIYTFTIDAGNGVGTDATQPFTLTVNQTASIQSAQRVTVKVGTPMPSLTIQVFGSPTPCLTYSQLPNGLSISPTCASFPTQFTLSGTPAAGSGGVYPITLKATNSVGSPAVQVLTITVDEAPTITSANSTTFTTGTTGTFTVTSTGYPLPTFSETGALPTGVTLTPAGVLSGMPAAGTANTYPITITATISPTILTTQSFTLTVVAPVLTATPAPPAGQTVAAGSSATYMIANSSTTVTYALTCTGLPTGAACGAVSVMPSASASLVISTTSRTLSGVPPSPGGKHFHIKLWPNASLALALSFVLLFAARKRKSLALIPLGTLALFLVFSAAGCGSGSSGPASNPNGTPAGTYTITVIGNVGPSQQTTTVVLIVQ